MEAIKVPSGCDSDVQAIVDEMVAKINDHRYPPSLGKSIAESLRLRLLEPGRAPCHYARQAKAIYAVAEAEARRGVK